MRNFIGTILISLAGIITFLRTCLFFVLIFGFAFGILVVTLIAFAELAGRINPNSYIEMPLDLFGKWYWEVIVFFLGAATMWQGVKKMFGDEKHERKEMSLK